MFVFNLGHESVVKNRRSEHKLVTSENMKRLRQIQKSHESQGHGRCAIDPEAHHVTMTASRARAPP